MIATRKRIKIAQVITRLDWGGSPDIVRILCGGLDPALFDVTLVSGPTAHPSAKTSEFLVSFPGRYIQLPTLVREIDPLKDVSALRDLARLFKKERFDIIHTHTAKAGTLGRAAGRMAGCRAIVHTPHGHTFYGYFGHAMTAAIVAVERAAAGWCDRIIALTELERQDMLWMKIAPADKIPVIYQGLELERYAARPGDREAARSLLGIGGEECAIGMVGRLETVKGARYFIEASAIVAVRSPNARFIVAGDGSLRQELVARAAALGLTDRFIFTGWRDDVPALLAGLDIFVMPSLNEAVGMALIEAQAAGIPAVATRVGGIPEVLADGKAGELVPPADAAALAEAVAALAADPLRRKQMGAAGAEFVSRRFKAAAMAERTITLYRELL